MSAQRRIIIVDDSKTFRDGLRFFLETILGHKVIAEASNGEEFLQLPDKAASEIILMDIEMPIMNGIKAAQLALNDYPLKIIAITNYEDKAYLLELISSGFKGFIAKKNIHQNLAECIDSVLAGNFVFPVGLRVDKKH